MHNFSDALYYKAYATMLKLIARTWFYQLPSSSIISFAQLTEKFRKYLMARISPKKDASYLMTPKQSKDEHLRDCLTRFAKAMYEIPFVDTSMAIEAFK